MRLSAHWSLYIAVVYFIDYSREVVECYTVTKIDVHDAARHLTSLLVYQDNVTTD